MRPLLLLSIFACASTPEPKPEPPKRPAPLEPVVVRPCEAVKALGSPERSLDALAAAGLREPKRIAPKTFSFGFADGSILSIDAATRELRLVSPATRAARTLGAPGQRVQSWAPGDAPGQVRYLTDDGWFQVSLDAPSTPPARAPAAEPPSTYLQELRRAGVENPGDAVRVSKRYGAVILYPPGGEVRLHAYDAETGALRPLLPKGLRLESVPLRLDDRRVVALAAGRYYVADVATAELSCATAPPPEGFAAWPSTALLGGRFLAYAASRVEADGSKTMKLGLADLIEGTDTAVGTFARRSSLELRAVPGSARAVLAVRRGAPANASTFYALDPPGDLRRLTPEISKVQGFDVSGDGTQLAFARGQEWNGPPRPPKPQRPEPPKLEDKLGRFERRHTCDPIRPSPGACDWVSNHCGDFVWAGFCPGTEPKPPPPDPADGLYLLGL